MTHSVHIRQPFPLVIPGITQLVLEKSGPSPRDGGIHGLSNVNLPHQADLTIATPE